MSVFFRVDIAKLELIGERAHRGASTVDVGLWWMYVLPGWRMFLVDGVCSKGKQVLGLKSAFRERFPFVMRLRASVFAELGSGHRDFFLCARLALEENRQARCWAGMDAGFWFGPTQPDILLLPSLILALRFSPFASTPC